MSLSKVFKALVSGLCMMLSSAAMAEPQPGPSQNINAPTEVGVISRIDTSRSQITINDRTYAYSALTLKVHKSGRASGVGSLQINQKVRFAYEFARPGSGLGAPIKLTDIWLD